MYKEAIEVRGERILAVRRDVLFADGRKLKNKFTTTNDARDNFGIDEYFLMSRGEYFTEEELKSQEDYIEAVTYTLIENERDRILSYQRGDREPGLKGKLSIGFGGHVRPIKKSERNVIRSSLLRSIDREISIGAFVEGLPILGYIYCEDSEVDKKHLGLLFLKKLGYVTNIEVRDSAKKDILKPEFITPSQIEKIMRKHSEDPIKYPEFEDWSKIAYDALLKNDRFR